jgi:hypothetical protein
VRKLLLVSIVALNPTAFAANVDVRGDQRDGWVGLATVQPESDATVRDVLDQGERWIFRFSYSGYEEEIELTRVDLDRARWRVEIPAGFEAELRSRGVPPPP